MKGTDKEKYRYVTGYARGWCESLQNLKKEVTAHPSEFEDIYDALVDYFEEELVPLAKSLGNFPPLPDPIPSLKAFESVAPISPKSDFPPYKRPPIDF